MTPANEFPGNIIYYLLFLGFLGFFAYSAYTRLTPASARTRGLPSTKIPVS